MARRTVFLAAMLALAAGCADSTPVSLPRQALQELRSGRYDQAIATCTEAMRENPADAEAYLYRGRAYQLRNALGDPARAIADLTEAIRLAPEASDAYYYRSLVYRDLGNQQLADVDDMKARQVDGRLQEVYRELPDPPPPATFARTPDQVTTGEPPSSPDAVASGDALPKSEAEQKKLYERLKKRFESPFDTARANKDDAKESFTERYRRLLREPVTEPEPDESPPDIFGTLGRLAPRLSPPNEPEAGLPAGQNAVQGGVRRPTPSSPFQPRVPSGVAADSAEPLSSPFGRQLRSPFPQRPPAPTGYVAPPASSLAPQSFGPFSQQPRQPSDNLYSNPAVRPPYPRDYIP
jgi:hypothetical protein